MVFTLTFVVLTPALLLPSCVAGYAATQASGNCAQCPAGKWSGNIAGECIECAAGKASAVTAAVSDDTCSVCPIGKAANAVSAATACIDCAFGHHATAESTACTACVIGKWYASNGEQVRPRSPRRRQPHGLTLPTPPCHSRLPHCCILSGLRLRGLRRWKIVICWFGYHLCLQQLSRRQVWRGWNGMQQLRRWEVH